MLNNKKQLKKINLIVDEILSHKARISALSDFALRNKKWEFQRRLVEGETLDDILPEAYAVVREAAKRVLGMEHFPVQLIGGIVLHQGRIAEMRTGEGKTLVATLPAYLNALSGKGVHVVTTNDYLAKRDKEQMGKVHEFLGLTVGAVLGKMSAEERRDAYDSDITYVTNSELGFDYLRDNMAKSRGQIVQRGFNYCIIDEIDSILIDEARTPLIISGKSSDSTKLYQACNVLAGRMTRGEDLKELSKLDIISGVQQQETGDFSVIEDENRIILTAAGIKRVERFFRIDNIADIENIEIQHHMNLALRANYLLEKDKDYVVKDGEVFIVDALTGRIMPGRRYSDGLHQAVEAKERVKIQKESRTVATVTYQSFFNKYKKLSGMTGTGKTEEQEFLDIYGMDIVEIPTNRPVIRLDKEDIVFKTKKEKLHAVCRDVIACKDSKRPVLVGTNSVYDSEELSEMFTQFGIAHSVLNAKNHEREAAIVAEAGRCGAVTIATNMAGRGTDIKLDEDARAAGGLLVIATQRHDSRRIDGQLCGRAGRQGDPGESRFYLSLEDELFRIYDKKRMEPLFEGSESGITSAAMTKAIEKAQRRVESDHFAQRRKLLEYDVVLNEQREKLYELRYRLLKERKLNALVCALIKNAAADALDNEENEQQAIAVFADFLLPYELTGCYVRSGEQLCEWLGERLLAHYQRIEDNFSDTNELYDRLRKMLLSIVDEQWLEHINDMQQLRQGIGLVSYAQKDPVLEYKMAAFKLFEQLNFNIRRDMAIAIMRMENVKE